MIENSKKVVAVKKLREELTHEGEQEFQTEMKAIGRTHHRNLARLLGYCSQGLERLLVFEYMTKGSLADILFTPKEGNPKPCWMERIRMAIDIARGIVYLHEGCEQTIIHCDIKPHNILMDEYGCAKISDFGLAKLLENDETRTTTLIRGTRGYWFFLAVARRDRLLLESILAVEVFCWILICVLFVTACYGGMLQHVFFRCDVARVVLRKICRWWDLDWQEICSFSDWDAWFLSFRLSSRLKSILEGVFYVAWWRIWRLRNQLVFDASPPNRSTIFDDIRYVNKESRGSHRKVANSPRPNSGDSAEFNSMLMQIMNLLPLPSQDPLFMNERFRGLELQFRDNGELALGSRIIRTLLSISIPYGEGSYEDDGDSNISTSKNYVDESCSFGRFKEISGHRCSGGSLCDLWRSMNFLSLNIQGLAQKAKKDWAKELCVKNKVNFLAIQETKMEEIDLFSVRRCWGNSTFEHLHSNSNFLSDHEPILLSRVGSMIMGSVPFPILSPLGSSRGL
ncbi:G-type lectin S-receptor-like serine/threonine-protein kinase LECRK3 [Tanacetum coccineum]